MLVVLVSLIFLQNRECAVGDTSLTLLAGKMGKSSDPMAVVDSKARVFGVQGLRVVDASAFPLLVPGHPQSTIYALAEKIADDIMRNA
jgi:choline dehydrogenase-like flavoprotein